MVLLAAVWALGWYTPPDPFSGTEAPLVLIIVTATVLASWNLVAGVIAAGFFHASSIHPASTFRSYRLASLRLMAVGIFWLFPVPLMAQVLGATAAGRALSLLVTVISIAAIVFGRARLHLVEERLDELSRIDARMATLAPWENGDRRTGSQRPPA